MKQGELFPRYELNDQIKLMAHWYQTGRISWSAYKNFCQKTAELMQHQRSIRD